MQTEYLSFNLQNQLLFIIWYKIVNRASKKKRLTVTDIGHPAPYSVIMGTHTSSGCLNSVTRYKHCYLICKLLFEIRVAPRIAKLAHSKAAGSGAASTAMAVPLFLKLKKKSKKLTQTHHRKLARICSDIAAVSVQVVCIILVS